MRDGPNWWTPERTERLKALVKEDLSSTDIANELGGASRNAVIGKVFRLGLKLFRAGDSKPRAAGLARRPRKPARGGKVRVVVNNGSTVLDDRALGLTSFEVPVEQRKSLLQLTDATCKFPHGDPATEDFYFCGGSAVDGSPYCAGHRRIAYTPLSERRSRGNLSAPFTRSSVPRFSAS